MPLGLDPIAHWPFDEAAGSVAGDVSGNGYDGTLVGPTWQAGHIGSALEFDGVDDIVDMGDILNGLDLPITVAAWVCLEGTGARYWLSTDTNASNYSGYWIGFNGTIEVAYGDGGTTSSSNRRSKYSDDLAPTGAWFHFAAVINGAKDMTIYVDASDAGGAYGGSGGPVAHTTDLFRLGIFVNNTGDNNAFDGRLDDVRIYDRALSHEEVQALADQ